jgi:hypothetical protein
MKVELDTEEAWNLFSRLIGQMLDEVQLADSDRAKVRRWKSDEMKVTSQEMRVLVQKVNEDIMKSIERKTKSQLRKPDWV